MSSLDSVVKGLGCSEAGTTGSVRHEWRDVIS
jgi:hypothetical protein